MHSKQKKECKKIGSPRMSKKESPKNLQKAQNKRKMRPPKKRVKSDNLELSVIDTLAFNLNSDKSSGSKLGEVKITPASVLPLVPRLHFKIHRVIRKNLMLKLLIYARKITLAVHLHVP